MKRNKKKERKAFHGGISKDGTPAWDGLFIFRFSYYVSPFNFIHEVCINLSFGAMEYFK